MKRSIVRMLVAFGLLASHTSCQESAKNGQLTEERNTVENVKEDTYDPGAGWMLDWADEFNAGTLDEGNWNRQIVEAGRFNEEWQRYTDRSQNAYVEDDCLVIAAVHEGDTHGHNQYTSARLNTANKQTWRYGKVAARIKLPQGMGIWPAFWMLGANINENGGDTPWPQCGEVDILELYGFEDDATVEANLHYADASGQHAMMGGVPFRLKEGIFADAFHVFELEWDEQQISWLVDGQQFAAKSIADPEFSEFHQDFFLLLNIAVGGTFAGRPDDTTVFPQHMYVDWVRVYKKG